ncbi:MAG: hypothetical protein HC786_20440 [Richelia sp. CSU_2_1]|nr:hypothetical protein [Richelia sp. CSU_2_1]
MSEKKWWSFDFLQQFMDEPTHIPSQEEVAQNLALAAELTEGAPRAIENYQALTSIVKADARIYEAKGDFVIAQIESGISKLETEVKVAESGGVASQKYAVCKERMARVSQLQQSLALQYGGILNGDSVRSLSGTK